MVGRRELICNNDNVASYTVLHNSTNVLHRGSLGASIVEKVGFISKEIKSYICRHLETMGESINLAFHARIVVEHVLVKFTELKGIPLEGRILERYCNVNF